MAIRSYVLGHPVEYRDGQWFFSKTKEPVPDYTPELVGSGQFGICAHCKKPPTPEGHDGCLGTLPEHVVMNACCGHGQAHQAYVQFWSGVCVRETTALQLIAELKLECN